MGSPGVTAETRVQGLFTFEIPRGVEVIECNKVWLNESILHFTQYFNDVSTAGAIVIAEIVSPNIPATLVSKFLTRTDMGGACVLWTTFPGGRFLAHTQGNIEFRLATLELTWLLVLAEC